MGLATMVDLTTTQIIDMELVHCSESGSSQMMETVGVERLLGRIHASGVRPDALVSDRGPSVRKMCREILDHRTQHRFDIWHIVKSFEKKMSKLTRRVAAKDAALWIKPLGKHMHTCAFSTPSGDGDIIAKKWLSSLKHVLGNHEDCLHPEREEHEDLTRYLLEDSEAYRVLKQVVSDPRLVADIRLMSPWQQTYMVECFHSILNRFCPKPVNWSFFGHLSRAWLASLHFNENATREVKMDSEGSPVYSLHKPKWKKTWIAKLEKCDQTYRYADEVMAGVIRQATEKRKVTLATLFDKPANLVAGVQKPTVEEVLRVRQPRGLI